MKLFKTLLIDGQEYPLAGEKMSLDIDRPGRAIFVITPDPDQGQSVDAARDLVGKVATFAMGWNFTGRQVLFMTCDVEKALPMDNRRVRLFCREISARMDGLLPLALRHPTLTEVLNAYSQKTGLAFITPNRPYAQTKVPAFYAVGTGFHALDSFGSIFSIPAYFWQTQADGRVFVGSYYDSRWCDKSIDIPQQFFKSVSAGGTKTITAIPSLRPGAIIGGERVKSVEFFGHEMSFSCEGIEHV